MQHHICDASMHAPCISPIKYNMSGPLALNITSLQSKVISVRENDRENLLEDLNTEERKWSVDKVHS